jgi:hypothetical protein
MLGRVARALCEEMAIGSKRSIMQMVSLFDGAADDGA